MLNRRSLMSGTAAVSALPAVALAQDPAPTGPQPGAATAASPDGVLTVELTADKDGFVAWAVSRLGRPVIAPSRLGFLLTDARKLERAFGILSQTVTSHDDTWEQPWGERRFIRNRYTRLRVELQERWGLMRRMDVVFRLYDDGLGFRCEFPEQENLKTVSIGAELTEFAVADPGTAWWLPAFEYNRAEYLYNRTDIDAVGVSQTPLTMRLEDGLHLSIHEAALVDYAGMNLRRVEGGKFRAMLTPGLTSAAVVRDTPFHTPWRTIQIADQAGGLVESSLILNLNEPNKLGDVSWFRPMKYIGIW